MMLFQIKENKNKRLVFKIVAFILVLTLFYGQKGIAQELNNKIVFKPNSKIKDYTPLLRNFLRNNKRNDIEIEFKKGVYHFYPERAFEKYIKISNNDNGIKKVGLPFIEFKSVKLNANNSDFIFHGGMVPFVIENVEESSLSNFNLNWDTPFTFEGTVTATNRKKNAFTLKVNKEEKYGIKNGTLKFYGYDWEKETGHTIIFDKEKRRPIYNTKTYGSWMQLIAREIEPRVIEFSNYRPHNDLPPIGSVWIAAGGEGNRNFPAFRLYKASNINLENINIYTAGAMALIGEKLNNVSLNNFNVTVPPNSNRMIGATADATHFVNCKGEISFNNCTFENMLDDGVNVHGAYMKVVELINENTVGLEFGHHQQDGFDFAETGDVLRFISRNSLKETQISKVLKINKVNQKYYEVTLDTNTKELSLNNAVENISWTPTVKMNNCIVRQNRARSVLVSTDKKIEISNNYFSSMMAGIRISGDANHWFESGPVTDVTISGNTFENIGIGGSKPQAILQIDPVIPSEYRRENYYHKSISFENNTIKTFDPLIVYALSVDGLTIKNNSIEQTNTYPQMFGNLPEIDLRNCNNVTIKGNVYKGNGKAEVSVLDCENVIKLKQKGFFKEFAKSVNTHFYQK